MVLMPDPPYLDMEKEKQKRMLRQIILQAKLRGKNGKRREGRSQKKRYV